jgi:hypothetical protein
MVVVQIVPLVIQAVRVVVAVRQIELAARETPQVLHQARATMVAMVSSMAVAVVAVLRQRVQRLLHAVVTAETVRLPA